LELHSDRKERVCLRKRGGEEERRLLCLELLAIKKKKKRKGGKGGGEGEPVGVFTLDPQKGEGGGGGDVPGFAYTTVVLTKRRGGERGRFLGNRYFAKSRKKGKRP